MHLSAPSDTLAANLFASGAYLEKSRKSRGGRTHASVRGATGVTTGHTLSRDVRCDVHDEQDVRNGCKGVERLYSCEQRELSVQMCQIHEAPSTRAKQSCSRRAM